MPRWTRLTEMNLIKTWLFTRLLSLHFSYTSPFSLVSLVYDRRVQVSFHSLPYFMQNVTHSIVIAFWGSRERESTDRRHWTWATPLTTFKQLTGTTFSIFINKIWCQFQALILSTWITDWSDFNWGRIMRTKGRNWAQQLSYWWFDLWTFDQGSSFKTLNARDIIEQSLKWLACTIQRFFGDLVST